MTTWLLIFALTSLAVHLIMSLMDPGKETAQQRLQRLVAKRKQLKEFVTLDLPGDPLDPEPDEKVEKKPGGAAREALVGIVEKMTTGRKFSNTLEIRLKRAGWKWKPAEFLVAQGLCAGVALGLSLISARSMVWLFPILGWLTPHFLLARSEKVRLKQFEQQLPDALSIISNALRSGYSFLQAMDVVSREMPDPIAREFDYVLRETRVNIPLEESLNHLVERVKSPDLDLVVTAVLIQRQVGGNLSQVLDKISGTIKERIRLQGEIRTLTTQGRISGWIVSLLPFGLAVLMSTVAPGYLTPMFQHPLGWIFVAIGALMQGIGILMIRKMVSLEV